MARLQWSLDAMSGRTVDHVGSVAGALCAVHCVTCGVAPGVLAGLGLGSVVLESLEWILTPVTVTMAGVVLFAQHPARYSLVRTCAFCALAVGLVLGHALEAETNESLGLAVIVLCGTGLSVLHVMNLRLFAMPKQRPEAS